jgi:hypothetical protein
MEINPVQYGYYSLDPLQIIIQTVRYFPAQDSAWKNSRLSNHRRFHYRPLQKGESLMIQKIIWLPILLSLVSTNFIAHPPIQLSQTETQAPAVEQQPPTDAIGPDDFPSGVNPLTGLPVSDPSNLSVPPALVSITNFPVKARPQAGLSFSPFVYEMYIGEGMTRFLAVFYGDYPQKENSSTQEQDSTSNKVTMDTAAIGPIRSGRLPYESLRKQLNGFLVMASAYSEVAQNLSQYSNFFGTDKNDINSAMLDVTQLEKIAKSNQKRLGDAALSGLMFSADAPSGGKPAKTIYIPFSYLNQVQWRYDAASGAYHRFQDNADGKTFIQATDRLTQKPLTYENVVIMFAQHNEIRPLMIDISLSYINLQPALLFRDGQMYPIYWTTKNEEYEKTTGRLRPIRFIDADGNPFALKPGQTWVEMMPLGTPYYETVESQTYFDLLNKKQPGSGNWTIHFSW